MNNFYITAKYKHKMIFDYLKSYRPKINYKMIREKKFLGTAGSLSYLSNSKEDFFLVSNCDIILDENYNKIVDYHIKNQNDLTIVASKKTIKFSYGLCNLDEKKKFHRF